MNNDWYFPKCQKRKSSYLAFEFDTMKASGGEKGAFSCLSTLFILPRVLIFLSDFVYKWEKNIQAMLLRVYYSFKTKGHIGSWLESIILKENSIKWSSFEKG